MLFKLIACFFRPQFVAWIPAIIAGIQYMTKEEGGAGGGTGGYTGGAGGSPMYVPTGSGPADRDFQRMLADMFKSFNALDRSDAVTGGQKASDSYRDLARGSDDYRATMEGQAADQFGTQGYLREAGRGTYADLQNQAQGNFDLQDRLENKGRQTYGQLQGQAQGNFDQQDFLERRGRQNYNQLQGQAQGNFNQQNALERAGRLAFEAGQDPQNALRDRTQGRIVDASRSGQSARGIAMSGYGAGIENQAVGDFNIDWENNQLSRLLAGLGGMTSANQAGVQSGQLGQGDLTAAMNSLTNANQAGVQSGNLGQSYLVNSLSALTNASDAGGRAGALGQNALTSGMSALTSGNTAANQSGALGNASLAGANAFAQQTPGAWMNWGLAPSQAMSGFDQYAASIMQQIIPYLNQGQGAGANAARFGLIQQGMDTQNNANNMNAFMTAMKGFSGSGGGGGGSSTPDYNSYDSGGSYTPYYEGYGGYGGGP